MDWITKGNSFGFRWPFTEKEVKEQIFIIHQVNNDREKKYKTASGRPLPPKVIELTGRDFINYCEQYNQRKK